MVNQTEFHDPNSHTEHEILVMTWQTTMNFTTQLAINNIVKTWVFGPSLTPILAFVEVTEWPVCLRSSALMSEAPWPFGFPLTPVEEASRMSRW